MRKIFFIIFFVCSCSNFFGQKVGIVLSGGGAGGLAHVGFLKALEQEGIPIDYICGTSIGAFVGGLYASGYSIEQIEHFITSNEFKQLTSGQIEKKLSYFFKKADDDASWLSLHLDLDSTFSANIPSTLINSVPLDFKMMELFTFPSAKANYNFDSLMVPFRCVASDVERKESIIFKEGNLTSSIRASMTYPFFIRPITKDGRLLFDGGLYNNFPSNVMYTDFYPDYILGCSVSDNSPAATEENLYLQLRSLLMNKSNYSMICESGLMVHPFSGVGLFDFEKGQMLLDSGYFATMRKMDSIKMQVIRRVSKEEIAIKRSLFNKTKSIISFEKIEIIGLKENQSEYVSMLLSGDSKLITQDKLSKRFFRLASDDKLKYLYPTAEINPLTGNYKLKIVTKKEKSFLVQIGGNFSNRPISEGYLGLQYNYLGKVAATFYGNAYFGKLNTSAFGKIRVDFSTKIPFYIEPSICFMRWDYFKSSSLFYNLLTPPFLIQRDSWAGLDVGLPVGNKSKFTFGGALAELTNIYYQSNFFTDKDTADRTYFDFGSINASFTFNTLNRKQYASEGTFINLRAKYVNGIENLYPGSTSVLKDTVKKAHQWFIFKATVDKYFKLSNKLKIGLLVETAFLTQSFFSNYTSTILSAPAFAPTPESKTLFLENYRAHKYLASGFKSIFNPIKNLDFRSEFYVFLPVNSILSNSQTNKAYYSVEFLYPHFNAMAAIVYHTPVGPLSFSVNYFENGKYSFSYLLHFGYTIFNKKSLD